MTQTSAHYLLALARPIARVCITATILLLLDTRSFCQILPVIINTQALVPLTKAVRLECSLIIHR